MIGTCPVICCASAVNAAIQETICAADSP